ncbi:hypothetical protein [Amycolatopsis sp. NPDC004625]|uniref:hypothetical protein n=1 Tax=Amycolatopsis sp. NPDC004625 TaxID=3154670 RepID=UPI0033A0E5CD
MPAALEIVEQPLLDLRGDVGAIVRAEARVFGGPSHRIDLDSCNAPTNGSITITPRRRSTLSRCKPASSPHRQPVQAAVMTSSRAIEPP